MAPPAGLRVVVIAVVLAVLAGGGWCKHSNARPGLLQKQRLVIEIPNIKACDVPDNAIQFLNFTNGMISKVDFAISAVFRITRAAPAINMIVIRIVKCRDVVSANTCELFQTWRFDRNVCKAHSDPMAVWKFALDATKPRLDCPSKPVRNLYTMNNVTVGAALLQSVPLPWEGNVWKVRMGVMETPTKYHYCSEVEMRAHHVRD